MFMFLHVDMITGNYTEDFEDASVSESMCSIDKVHYVINLVYTMSCHIFHFLSVSVGFTLTEFLKLG